jgi:pilus assembly protein CpaB
MRRGGRLLLLLLILVLVAGALIYFLFSQPALTTPPEVTPQPTEEVTRSIVVARIDIPANTVMTDTVTYLNTREIPESEFNAAAGQYFTDPAQLVNKQTVQQVNFDQPIRRADVVDSGLSILIPTAQPGQTRPKAIPLRVDNLSGVADLIRPGDFVDVLSSFEIQVTVIRPGFDQNNQIVFREEPLTGRTTKTLIQNVQVLQILKPAVPQGTPTADGSAPAPAPAETQSGPPATDASGQPIAQGQATASPPPGSTGTFTEGEWILVLALTDQQAEILKFSGEAGTITLVLRGRGDSAVEETIGSTLEILVGQFGLPVPGAVPPSVISPADLTPGPTTNAAPAAPAAPVGTPSVTPTP